MSATQPSKALASEAREVVDASSVQQALQGDMPLSELNHVEQELYFELLEEIQDAPSPVEAAFFAARRERGVGVGINELGEIVWERRKTGNPD